MLRPLLTRLAQAVRRTPVPPEPPAPVMAPEDIEVIHAYAAGEGSLRDQAIAIHRRYIPMLGVRGTVEMEYMAEVDNVCPDYGWCALIKERMLGRKAA